MDLKDPAYRTLKILDLEQRFRETPDPIILNKFDITQAGCPESLMAALFGIRYDTNAPKGQSRIRPQEYHFAPSCDCGHLTGNIYNGMKCYKCNTVVIDPVQASRGDIPNNTWLSIPEAIPGVLNAISYLILSKWLKPPSTKTKKETDSYIDIICNPALPLPAHLEDVITGRGFTWFYNNFDYIVNYFIENYKYGGGTNKAAKAKAQKMRVFITLYRDKLFTRHLPILSKALHTVTTADNNETSGRLYTDESAKYALIAAEELSALEFSPDTPNKKRNFDAKLHSAYKSYIQYITSTLIMKMTKKSSIIRQHMFGARYHGSARSVVVPISGPHRYDELHTPWGLTVNLCTIEIISTLIKKYRMTYPEAYAVHHKAQYVYDPRVHGIINGLIASSEFDGIPVLFNRNPSIRRGAVELKFITRVKIDTYDKSVGTSYLTVRASNTDFDKQVSVEVKSRNKAWNSYNQDNTTGHMSNM